MAKRPKSEKTSASVVAVGLWIRTVEGRYYETQSVGERSTGGKVDELDCECGARSTDLDWNQEELAWCGEEVAICPTCGTHYVLSVPEGECVESTQPEPEHSFCGGAVEIPRPESEPSFHADLPPEELPYPELTEAKQKKKSEAVQALATVTSDGEVLSAAPAGDTKSRQVGILNEEAIELYYRVEQLGDEKAAYMSDWKAEKDKLQKRIKEIRAEVAAIRAGKTVEEEPASLPTEIEKQLNLYGDQGEL